MLNGLHSGGKQCYYFWAFPLTLERLSVAQFVAGGIVLRGGGITLQLSFCILLSHNTHTGTVGIRLPASSRIVTAINVSAVLSQMNHKLHLEFYEIGAALVLAAARYFCPKTAIQE